MSKAYPFLHHPCWSVTRENLWERIHLPIAKNCNLRCAFCSGQQSSCHGIGPGYSSKTMNIDTAKRVLIRELASRPNLRIVGISGPGEPLFNQATFELLKFISDNGKKLKTCVSSNGILLSSKAEVLRRLELNTLSISISAIRPDTAAHLYRQAIIDGETMVGVIMGKTVIKLQLEGLRLASELGIPTKVNTVLVPGINDGEIGELARSIKENGASLHNIMPLVPRGMLRHHRAPAENEVLNAREKASRYIEQFSHCKRCRSDVVGLPGCDTILT